MLHLVLLNSTSTSTKSCLFVLLYYFSHLGLDLITKYEPLHHSKC